MSKNIDVTPPPDLNNSISNNNSIESIKLYPDNINVNNDKPVNKSNWHWIQVSSVCIIRVILFLIAGSLAWNCNKKETLLLRVIISCLAGTFSEFYIIYYAIYRVYLGNKCPI